MELFHPTYNWWRGPPCWDGFSKSSPALRESKKIISKLCGVSSFPDVNVVSKASISQLTRRNESFVYLYGSSQNVINHPPDFPGSCKECTRDTASFCATCILKIHPEHISETDSVDSESWQFLKLRMTWAMKKTLRLFRVCKRVILPS